MENIHTILGVWNQYSNNCWYPKINAFKASEIHECKAIYSTVYIYFYIRLVTLYIIRGNCLGRCVLLYVTK